MKSIIKGVLEREEKKASAAGQPQPPAPSGGGFAARMQQTAPAMKTTERIEVESVQPGTNPEDEELRRVLASLRTNIKIVGCGGAGCNTINRVVEEGIVGADIFALNTDAQHLLTVHAPHKILIGRRSTRGLGAGSVPQIGGEAANLAVYTNKGNSPRGHDHRARWTELLDTCLSDTLIDYIG